MEEMKFREHFDVMISPEEVARRTAELGTQISNDYGEEPVVAVGILRGCVMFYSQLLKSMACPTLLDFMYVSSYGDSMKSSGSVKIERDLQTEIEGKHVLLIDDIVDTGLTLSNLKRMLQTRGPKSIKICTMLDKKEARSNPIEVDYSAFSIENYFVVGYGLDYRQYFRNMNFIGRLKNGHQAILDKWIDQLD